MLKIDNLNNITLTKGDTLTLTVSLIKEDQPYTPEVGDVIRFACSKGFVGETAYELKFSEPIPNDTLTVTIPAATTALLEYKTYNYDVEITHADGSVDTVIVATLTITGEAK